MNTKRNTKTLILMALCFIEFLIIAKDLSAQSKYTSDRIKIQGEAKSIFVPQRDLLPKKEVIDKTKSRNKDTIQQIETVFKNELAKYILEMQNQKFISENVIPEVTLEIVNNEKPALKVVYSYSLLSDSLKYKTDDFSLGDYRIESSKAVQIALAFMKQNIEGQLSKYFTPQKEVIITIYGSADAIPVRKVIEYKGEYGKSISENCEVEGVNQKISISITSGIENNIALAFIRSYGVRYFIEKQIIPLKETSNRFIHRAFESKSLGGKFRRVTIQLEIPYVFENYTTN